MKRTLEIVLMVGIPGSGKSTLYQELFSKSHVRVSLDMLKTRKREFSLFEWCLLNRQSCVVDDTNITRDIRSRWISEALGAQATVSGYFLQSRIADCLERNLQRQGKARIPDAAVKHHHAVLELPSMNEGFTSLHYVSIGDGKFEINPWKI